MWAVLLKHFHTTTIVANSITVNGVSVVSTKPAEKLLKSFFFLKKKEVSQGQEHCPIFNNSSYGNDMLVASGNFSTVYCILNQLRSLIYTENSEGVNNSFLYVVSLIAFLLTLSVELQGIYVAMYSSLFLISHK